MDSAGLCEVCEQGSLHLTTGRGRFSRGRGGVKFEIPEELPILECDHCGAHLLDGETMRLLGAAEARVVLHENRSIFVQHHPTVYIEPMAKFHFSAYWRSWSRVLSDRHPGGPFVEISLTPVQGWAEIEEVRIRCHGTARDSGDLSVDELPREVLEQMRANLPEALIQDLLSKDYLAEVDWEKSKAWSGGGGCPFALCRKSALSSQRREKWRNAK